MSEARFRRPRHQTVATALASMNGPFLEQSRCYFGGGTRIVLELGEYRESEDLDFLCSSPEGYRALRSTVTDTSLGAILAAPVELAREVRADRYGIRTFLDVGGSKVKIEIVLEGRLRLHGEPCTGLPVPCLDRISCFAEKFLANADRGNDEAVLGRDVIDLAFMLEGWGETPARDGAALAREAYGEVVDRAARAAAKHLLDRKDYLRRCISALSVSDAKTLASGLTRLAKTDWARKVSRRRRAAE
jgi:Nucleotidyl transferase AbiEii toxin, Type IV TA system